MDGLSDKLATAKLGAGSKNVHLPLSKLDRCHKCGATDEKLFKICSSCGERVYCSTECQKADWDFHKKSCGKSKNDRIDIATFYPVLAILAEACRSRKERPVHPALDYQILNDVNPSSRPVCLPDGLGVSRLLQLGEKIGHGKMDLNYSNGWFVKAQSLKVQAKLYERVRREGYALPIALAVCISLLAQIYTTDFCPSASSSSSPPAPGGERHFGIANGEAYVKSQDKLAYWFPDGSIMPGQDSKDHYWVYFTTIKGEEVTFDVSMFTFNNCLLVSTSPYANSLPILNGHGVIQEFVPAYFRDRIQDQGSPRIYKERKKESVLRNTALHGAVSNLARAGPEAGISAADSKAILNFLNDFAAPTSGQPSPKERELTLIWTVATSLHLGKCVASGEWKNFPEEVPIAFERDPGQLENLDDPVQWDRCTKEWKRKYKKAKASEKQE